MLLQPCEVLLVRNNVSEAEILKDVIHSLDTLKITMDNVFKRLEDMAALERNRLQIIKDRIAKCNHKVQALKGSKRPTTVFSTAKFPGTETFPLFTSKLLATETAIVTFLHHCWRVTMICFTERRRFIKEHTVMTA